MRILFSDFFETQKYDFQFFFKMRSLMPMCTKSLLMHRAVINCKTRKTIAPPPDHQLKISYMGKPTEQVLRNNNL
jgi:hypothetical protein